MEFNENQIAWMRDKLINSKSVGRELNLTAAKEHGDSSMTSHYKDSWVAWAISPKTSIAFGKHSRTAYFLPLLPKVKAVVFEDIKKNGYNSKFIITVQFVRRYLVPMLKQTESQLTSKLRNYPEKMESELNLANASMLNYLNTVYNK